MQTTSLSSSSDEFDAENPCFLIALAGTCPSEFDQRNHVRRRADGLALVLPTLPIEQIFEE